MTRRRLSPPFPYKLKNRFMRGGNDSSGVYKQRSHCSLKILPCFCRVWRTTRALFLTIFDLSAPHKDLGDTRLHVNFDKPSSVSPSPYRLKKSIYAGRERSPCCLIKRTRACSFNIRRTNMNMFINVRFGVRHLVRIRETTGVLSNRRRWRCLPFPI